MPKDKIWPLLDWATPNNYRIDRISDAPVRNKKRTVITLILLDKFRAEKGR
jgi:hypothetical protein